MLLYPYVLISKMFEHTLGLLIRGVFENYCSYFLTKTYVVGTQKNCLNESYMEFLCNEYWSYRACDLSAIKKIDFRREVAARFYIGCSCKIADRSSMHNSLAATDFDRRLVAKVF